jgi:hypothetical protein
MISRDMRDVRIVGDGLGYTPKIVSRMGFPVIDQLLSMVA